MCCGRCCVTEPRSRAALQLDIFIEILLGTRVNKLSEEPRCTVPGKRPGLLVTPAPFQAGRRVSTTPQSLVRLRSRG
jgi:hypothetical protein